MSFNDIDCVRACATTYDGSRAIANFNYWYCGPTTDGVAAGIILRPDASMIAFRGSLTFIDWIRDFDARMIQSPIGRVDQGFFIGLEDFLADAMPLLPKDKPVFVTGHSLGGARAQIFAGLLIMNGYQVVVVTFGEPRPGDAMLAKTLQPFPNRPYKNCNDYVTDVPLPMPFAEYTHPRLLIQVYAIPAPGDEWGPLAPHHIELYQTALQKIQIAREAKNATSTSQ